MFKNIFCGYDGTAGLGYWTHEPDGSLPLAQLERPIAWASPRRSTSIHTYIHTHTYKKLLGRKALAEEGESVFCFTRLSHLSRFTSLDTSLTRTPIFN